MTRYKVSELDGELLDAAVALAEGFELRLSHGRILADQGDKSDVPRRYSSNWVVGGPIIERELIAVIYMTGFHESAGCWCAFVPGKGPYDAGSELIEAFDFNADGKGDSMLIAAMRAYVASKFGDEVELP